MPESDPTGRTGLIGRALAEARRVEDREVRLGLLGKVADAWLERGEPGRAVPIIREGQAILEGLPKDRYSSNGEDFGHLLALIDLPAARRIFERKGVTNASPTDPATLNRHLTDAAVRLASIDPAGAERLLPKSTQNFWDAQDHVLQVCRRMARTDLARAGGSSRRPSSRATWVRRAGTSSSARGSA